LLIACPGCQEIDVGLKLGDIISILDGCDDLCVVSEKLAVVVEAGWHVVDEQRKTGVVLGRNLGALH